VKAAAGGDVAGKRVEVGEGNTLRNSVKPDGTRQRSSGMEDPAGRLVVRARPRSAPERDVLTKYGPRVDLRW